MYWFPRTTLDLHYSNQLDILVGALPPSATLSPPAPPPGEQQWLYGGGGGGASSDSGCGDSTVSDDVTTSYVNVPSDVAEDELQDDAVAGTPLLPLSSAAIRYHRTTADRSHYEDKSPIRPKPPPKPCFPLPPPPPPPVAVFHCQETKPPPGDLKSDHNYYDDTNSSSSVKSGSSFTFPPPPPASCFQCTETKAPVLSSLKETCTKNQSAAFWQPERVEMTTLRKAPLPADPLPSVKYTAANRDDDLDDSLGSQDTLGKLAFITTDTGHNRTLSSSTAVSSPPPSAMTMSSNNPYYDFHDTDDNDESELCGADSNGDLCTPTPADSLTGLPCNGNGTIKSYSHSYQNHNSNSLKHPNHNHHPSISEKTSCDSTLGRHRPPRHMDMMDSRDFSKSSLTRRRGHDPGSKGRCMCCMMCVFLLSTASLGAVLALTYAGHVTLRPQDHAQRTSFVTHSNGGSKIDRLGDEKVITKVMFIFLSI